MKEKGLALAIVFAAIGFVIVYALTDGFTKDEITVGGLSISGSRGGDVVALINSSTSSPALGNWDSLDAPYRGNAYQVPTGKRLEIYTLQATNTATSSITLILGYASARVTSTSTTPAGQVVIWTGTLSATGTFTTIPLKARIPASQYPFIRVTSAIAATWPSDVTAFGVER